MDALRQRIAPEGRKWKKAVFGLREAPDRLGNTSGGINHQPSIFEQAKYPSMG
jgi:hypothetical protein